MYASRSRISSSLNVLSSPVGIGDVFESWRDSISDFMTVTVSGASGFGRMLYMSTGQSSEAVAAFERALNLRRRLLDKNDSRIADSLFHLGVQQGLASAQGAEDSLQECLCLCRHRLVVLWQSSKLTQVTACCEIRVLINLESSFDYPDSQRAATSN